MAPTQAAADRGKWVQRHGQKCSNHLAISLWWELLFCQAFDRWWGFFMVNPVSGFICCSPFPFYYFSVLQCYGKGDWAGWTSSVPSNSMAESKHISSYQRTKHTSRMQAERLRVPLLSHYITQRAVAKGQNTPSPKNSICTMNSQSRNKLRVKEERQLYNLYIFTLYICPWRWPVVSQDTRTLWKTIDIEAGSPQTPDHFLFSRPIQKLR